MLSFSRFSGVVLLALAVFGVLGSANLLLGDLNQDEGWYLYAAQQVDAGHLPFRDFAFTQGPVMPLVYFASLPMVSHWGLAGGRLFTAVIGLAATLLAALLAARSVPKGGARYAFALTCVLLCVNVYHSYFTTIVKTYALCGLFLAAAMLLLSFVRSDRGAAGCFFAGVLLALAAGVRISAGISLAVVGGFLVLHRGRLGHVCWIAFGVGGALGLAVVFLPFLLMAPEAFWFGMVEYHSLRVAGTLVSTLAYKVGFLSRFIQAYFVAVVLWLALVLFRRSRVVARVGDDREAMAARFPGLVWAVGLAVSLVHFAAPFPYDDYQVLVAPILVAALAGAWVRVFMASDPTAGEEAEGAPRARPWAWGLLVLVFLASLAASGSSMVNQNWFVAGQDRIWWRLKPQPDLCRLHQVAGAIRELAGESDQVLTQDTYLAVEAGLSVPPGLEMGPFSYYPEFSAERAAALHVLNHDMMVDLLRTSKAQVAAFSGYGLSIAGPGIEELPEAARNELWAVLRERYEPAGEWERFGQAHTTLKLLKRIPEPEPQAEAYAEEGAAP